MSKDIKITEGGVARNFTDIKKLYTRLSDGTMQSWIPVGDVSEYGHYINITISQSGTFIAPLDGFSTVVVNVLPTTEVSGTEDGEQVVYTVDADGNLVRTVVDV